MPFQILNVNMTSSSENSHRHKHIRCGHIKNTWMRTSTKERTEVRHEQTSPAASAVGSLRPPCLPLPLRQLEVFASCVCHNLKEAYCLREAVESTGRLRWFLLEIGKMDEQEI